MAGPSIQVYQLVPASTLFGLREPLQSAIFARDIFVDQKEKVFAVSASSGWMSFVDYSALWKLGNPGLLPQSTQEVLKAAEDFLDRVNTRTQSFNQSTKAGLRSLLPDRDQRQFESCSLVMRPDKTGFDHWLCRYSIAMTAGTETALRVPVLGMCIEMRIGAKGAIIGFMAQWRPVLRTIYADLYPYEQFAFLLKDEEQPDNADNPDAGKLLYSYDGAAGNQYYLAPYYYLAMNDHVQLSPASKYSLVVKILEEETSDGTRLTGRAYGGSGAYAFNWAFLNLDTAWQKEGGVVVLGEGDTRRQQDEAGPALESVQGLPRSFYTVMLNVTDQRSGAYRHFQQAVYSRSRTEPYANV